MSSITRRTAVAAIVAGVVGLGVVGGAALADTPTPTSAPATPRSSRFQASYQDYLDKVAQQLGIDRTKLEAAMKEAQKQMVDEAVAAGNLTQAQGDAMKARIDSAPEPGPFGFKGYGGPGPVDGQALAGVGQTAQEAIAGKLGMTVDELRTELRSGKKLSDIAASKNVSQDQLKQAVTDAVKPKLDAAVSSGQLTQAQADSMLARITSSASFDSQLGDRPHPGFRGRFGQRPAPTATP